MSTTGGERITAQSLQPIETRTQNTKPEKGWRMQLNGKVLAWHAQSLRIIGFNPQYLEDLRKSRCK